MKKKLIAISLIMIMMISMVACGKNKEASTGETEVGLANPWTETTEEAAFNETYFLFKAPDDATNVVWRRMENGEYPLIEIDFTLGMYDFCARAQYGAAEGEDISGIFTEWPDSREEVLSGWWDGNAKATIKSAQIDDAVTFLCTWYDTEAGEVYSLSTSTQDDSQLDMIAVANAMFDETKVPGYNAPDAEETEEISEEEIEETHMGLDISGCDTFTQIVDQKLTDGMGYANATIDGTDVLLVSTGTYDYNAGEGDPMWVAIDSEIYYYDADGSIGYMGYVGAGGTAYPLAIKDGKLYVGRNHGLAKITVDPEMGGWFIDDQVWVEYDSDGNETYYHHSDTHGGDDEQLDDDSMFNEYFDEYLEAEPVVFDTVHK